MFASHAQRKLTECEGVVDEVRLYQRIWVHAKCVLHPIIQREVLILLPHYDEKNWNGLGC